MRKSKELLVADLVAAGFKITSNRKEGNGEYDSKRNYVITRQIEVCIPGSLWSREVGDWCNKIKQRANERRVIGMLKEAVGKEAAFDLCDHDMGHSSEGNAADDAHCHFYVYTST